MPFAAALSTNTDAPLAVEEVATAAKRLSGRADLAVVFFSAHHYGEADALIADLASKVNAKAMIGCLGEAIVGPHREIENEPAISLWLADFGGRVTVDPFHLTPEVTPDGPSLLGYPDALDECDPKQAAMLVLGDPYTFPLNELFFPRIQDECPGLAVVGGMSSGSPGAGQTLLVHGGEVVSVGAVGALLRGPGLSRTVVSQGCRPIGRHLVITKGHDNVIEEVSGQPPLVYLQELFQTLPVKDQELVQRALHVGVVMSEYRESFGRGDFLIRNIMGIDQHTGALAITDRVRVGQTIQFQVRDAAAADDDLRTLLKADNTKHGAASGSLLFTCNGRGTRMFPTPNHDVKCLEDEFGPLPVSGFFAAGEFGPVGGVNYIHGFTASVVLFE
ncbi:FIST N-terminal domain-containing protein [soil metagenome]